jgi:hypothetical protein
MMGDVIVRETILGERHFMLTSRLHVGDSVVRVFTEIPPGAIQSDLGRSFSAAIVEVEPAGPEEPQQ